MTRHLFTSALFAGLAAGLFAALLQFVLVTPPLLEGELYESGQRVHFAASPEGTAQSPAGPAGEPTQNITRHLTTAGFNVVTYTAFALLMVAGMAMAARSGHMVTARLGILWGLAGFIALHLAPAAGLPPELPGSVAAEVELRQVWWLVTVACTVLGLALIAYGRSIRIATLGIVAIALPHIIGAPHLDTYFGVAPPELSALFAARSLAVAAASWAFLGFLAAYFWTRHGAQTD